MFIGNPGAGKSTLANCVAKKNLFESGINYGQGLTFQLDWKVHNGITYIDTPGLADIKLRQEAAKAITEALKKDGIYQIFFVITLQSGRLRPEDMATIRTVLEGASDIKHYSIIISKLSGNAYNGLIQDKGKQLKILMAEIIEQINCKNNPPTILLLLNQIELYHAKNKFIKVDELDKFAEEAPCITVKPASVVDINDDPSSFEKLLKILIQQLNELRNNRNRLLKLLKDTDVIYRKLQLLEPEDEKVPYLMFLLSC